MPHKPTVEISGAIPEMYSRRELAALKQMLADYETGLQRKPDSSRLQANRDRLANLIQLIEATRQP